jgi:hypothetical protein
MYSIDHYDVKITIDGEDLIGSIREDSDFEVLSFSYPGVINASRKFQITASGYTIQYSPKPELQALLDLGYTEDQGVTMLNAIKEN